MALLQIHEKPNAVPVNASVFVLETLVSGVWYTRKVTWEQLCGLISALDTLQNYYKKSETYTKQEVNALIAQIPSFTVEVVQELPTTDISTTTLYLVPKTTAGTLDYYDEYINLDGTTSGWEYVGKTEVDLSNYYTKAETEAYVQGDGADYIVGTKTYSTLTTTAQSILAAINEVDSHADAAQADATQALSDASTAQGTANSASTAAGNAQSTADSAVTAAGNAAAAAAAAQQTANQAVTAAGNAQTTADGKSTVSISNVQGQSADNTRDKVADVTINGTTSSLYADNATKVIKQLKTPKTVTGNPVTFETVEETYAKGAELTFGPIQDLHGYDSPWPGGAGKNKLQNVASTNTDNGITFTVNSDGTVTANGTATATAQFYINRVYNSNLAQNLAPYTGQSVIMNGCPSGGSASTYRITFARIDGENFYDETGTGLSATVADLTGVNAYVRIQIENGVTVNNLTFKPMIRLATETDASFAPYENICPISGRDSVSLAVGGKNQLDEATAAIYKGAISTTAFTYTPTSSSYYLKARKNTAYTISMNNSSATIFRCATANELPDASESFTVIQIRNYNAISSGTGSFTINTGSDEYIIIQTNQTLVNGRNCGIQVELGSTATEYKPYIAPRTTTQAFSSTEYGATGSIKDGDWDRTTRLVDLGDLTWEYVSSSQYFRARLTDGITPISGGSANALCSKYKTKVGGTSSTFNDGECWYASTSVSTLCYIAVKDLKYTDAATFKAAVAGVQLCYELATPEAITGGTAQDILLNAGTNVASTDADTAAITYTEMTTLDDTPEGGGGGGGIDYSTSEVNTGLKWINNKPIYQRTFSVTIPQYDNSISGYPIASGVTYIDDLVEINGSIKKTASGSSSNTYAGLDGVQGTDGWKVSPHIDDGVLMLWSGSSSYGGDIVGATATITIKYTKTS